MEHHDSAILGIRPLFGGAISLMIPDTFEDISIIREVPDHQEVHVDRLSDMSIIIELLSCETDVSDDKVACHYYQDLSQCNEATNVQVLYNEFNKDPTFMPYIAPTFTRAVLVGTQTVVKFKRGETRKEMGGDPLDKSVGDHILIIMCVIRLVDVGTDVLITLNVPWGSTLSQVQLPQLTKGVLSMPPNTPAALDTQSNAAKIDIPKDCFEIMRFALHSFKINDWSLFA